MRAILFGGAVAPFATKHAIEALCILATLVCSTASQAFEFPKMPLDQKVAKATLVFVGTVEDVDFQDRQRAGNERLALVRVDQALKGSPDKDVRVVYRNGIVEYALDCCVKEGRYLFFLTQDKRGFYESVSGADGVYRVDVAPVVSRN